MDGHSRQQRSAGRWCYSPRTPQGWGGWVGTGCSAGPPQAESPESFPGSVQLPVSEKKQVQTMFHSKLFKNELRGANTMLDDSKCVKTKTKKKQQR